MIFTRTHGIYLTHGIDNTHGIDLDSWYRIGTPESHTYERAECCMYAEFFMEPFPNTPDKKILSKIAKPVVVYQGGRN